MKIVKIERENGQIRFWIGTEYGEDQWRMYSNELETLFQSAAQFQPNIVEARKYILGSRKEKVRIATEELAKLEKELQEEEIKLKQFNESYSVPFVEEPLHPPQMVKIEKCERCQSILSNVETGIVEVAWKDSRMMVCGPCAGILTARQGWKEIARAK